MRQLLLSLSMLPRPARVWWLMVVGLAVLLLPWNLAIEQPRPPLWVPLVVGLGNALLVVGTAYRRQGKTAGATFDYGGVASVTTLVLGGPAAAQVVFASEKLAAALVRNARGERSPWVKSVFNLAWGCTAIAGAWQAERLAPDSVWAPLLAASVWWLGNGLLVGPIIALSQGQSWHDGARLALTNDGWLRAQEAVLVIFAVLAWHVHPLLLGGVGLLLLGQAETVWRLMHEYEMAAIARDEAEAAQRLAAAEAARARHDPLTRLPNRYALAEILEVPPRQPGVLMIDLDHFKVINDRYGHAAGDAVLVEVAHAIRAALRPVDFCARMGGEEFCALLSDVESDDHLLAIAERVRQAIAEVRPAAYPAVRVSASIGAVRLPPGLTVDDALRYADRATYRAKAEGRDRISLYAAA